MKRTLKRSAKQKTIDKLNQLEQQGNIYLEKYGYPIAYFSGLFIGLAVGIVLGRLLC